MHGLAERTPPPKEPEDLHYYDNIFPVVKLATRQHSHPRMVFDAYTSRRFNGNLLNLMEASFAPIFAPYYIDNSLFPDDWFINSSKCTTCNNCKYCEKVLKQVMKIII